MKVYISKSNQGEMDILLTIREIIRKAGHELLEYNGGQYDPNLIKTAEVVITAPRAKEAIVGLNMFVGKGQASEARKDGSGYLYHPVERKFFQIEAITEHDPKDFKLKNSIITFNDRIAIEDVIPEFLSVGSSML